MNNATIMNMVRQANMTKRQSIRACQQIAWELEYRMHRAKRNPFVRSWTADSGTPHELAHEAFCHSIVHTGR